MLFGGIETGGTKFVCAVSDENQNILDIIRIPTTSPKQMLDEIFSFFAKHNIRSLGVGAFGPIGINLNQPDYGYIKMTPKVGWSNFNFLNALKKQFNVPIYWTTDVGVAAYGEYMNGAAQTTQHALYLTVGTGIGGCMVNNGILYQGMSHSEIGHIRIAPYKGDDFGGICPYHINCLEGMASGPAIKERTGMTASKLPLDSQYWILEAYYLAQAAVDYTLMFSPEIIIFGGGVSNQKQLFPLIRKSFENQLNGYVDTPLLDKYLVHAQLGDQAGIVGALLLAKKVYENSKSKLNKCYL